MSFTLKKGIRDWGSGIGEKKKDRLTEFEFVSKLGFSFHYNQQVLPFWGKMDYIKVCI